MKPGWGTARPIARGRPGSPIQVSRRLSLRREPAKDSCSRQTLIAGWATLWMAARTTSMFLPVPPMPLLQGVAAKGLALFGESPKTCQSQVGGIHSKPNLVAPQNPCNGKGKSGPGRQCRTFSSHTQRSIV